MQPFSRLIGLMNGAGVIWTFALTFLICADIFGRTVLDSPIRGVAEIVSLSLVASVFLQLAFAISQRRLTTVEFLVMRLRSSQPRLALDWNAVVSVAGIAMCLAIAAGMWPDLWRAFRTAEFAGVPGLFSVSVWPIKLIVFVGALVAAVECGRCAVSDLAERATGPAAGEARLAGGTRLKALLIPAVVALACALLWFGDVSPRLVGAAMIALLLALIVFGVPIAFSLLLTGFLGIAILRQDFEVATRTLSLAAEGTVSEYVFASVPLFVLMGLFVNVSDIGRDAFRAAQLIFGWIRGGLGVATIAANAVFAAITGISIASAAIFSKIAVPEMIREGYTPKFAVGLTAGSSVLGMLIPPSILFIIYGVIAEVSIGALFRAAVVPGILLAVAFAIGTVLMATFMPDYVGRPGRAKGGYGETPSAGQTLLGLVPVAILIVVVLGGIYMGIFAPHEAGAAGAFAAMLLALIKRRLNGPKLWEVIRETGQVSVTILFLIIAASTFSRMLTLTELPQDIAVFLGDTGLGMFGFLAIYLVLMLLLGMVLDSTSILLILVPIALPVVTALGGNLVWFGVISVIVVEIGLLTPPFGLSAFVIKSSLDDQSISLGTIFAGAFPFVLITLFVTILLMAFPAISLWL
jgi:tripartite ATP-independent transporter DctM subunit